MLKHLRTWYKLSETMLLGHDNLNVFLDNDTDAGATFPLPSNGLTVSSYSTNPVVSWSKSE